MNGLIIYDSSGFARNKWFVDKLIDCCNAVNINLQLNICDDGSLTFDSLPDFAIVRVIAPQINKKLEDNGVRVFNNYLTSSVANDKWQTYLLCQDLGIPVISTHIDSTAHNLDNFPLVLKSCDGHGGREVFMVNNADEFNKTDIYFRSLGKRYIAQKPCSDLGKDMRLYMLGGQVIAGILRYNTNDFKSNYSLGGSARAVIPCDYQLQIANRIYRRLKCDYVGIDFVLNNGKWILNEIEDVVGARMLYAETKLEIAEMFVKHILKEMSLK